MIRGIEFYFVMWILVSLAIIGWRQLTGKEKWELAKVLAFSSITAVVALFLVILIVLIF